MNGSIPSKIFSLFLIFKVMGCVNGGSHVSRIGNINQRKLVSKPQNVKRTDIPKALQHDSATETAGWTYSSHGSWKEINKRAGGNLIRRQESHSHIHANQDQEHKQQNHENVDISENAGRDHDHVHSHIEEHKEKPFHHGQSHAESESTSFEEALEELTKSEQLIPIINDLTFMTLIILHLPAIIPTIIIPLLFSIAGVLLMPVVRYNYLVNYKVDAGEV